MIEMHSKLKVKPQVRPMHRPQLKAPTWQGEAFRTIIFVIVVTVLFDMAIPRSLVDGRSMQPTFEDGERLIVSRVHYLLSWPQRGDVIVFNSLEEPDIMLIKRVIGEPGDLVEFRNQEVTIGDAVERRQQVFVNGHVLEEDYIKESCTHCQDESWQLGPEEFFVMGDNRNNSKDSRSFGPVSIHNVVGRVIFRYWPLPRIGVVQALDYEGVEP